MTDSQSLLADYVQTGSDRAFRELVTRYVDLVYSTALRLVDGDAHRAQDVAQTVFVNLTRAARTLSAEVLFGGWLHRHTCFVAANVMRGERRRQTRERQAAEMNALQTTPEPDFQRIAPLLDDAINELGDADRTAILLRFYERNDFRAVGQALGSNEDAARMRVNRALDKLQELLKHRGLTSTAAALSVVLSANAVQAAPVGLALTISTAAALTGTTLATAATATKAIAMTTLQKTIITATIAVLAGAGIYEARQAAQWREQVQTLQQQQAPLTEQIQQLQEQQKRDSDTISGLNEASANTAKNSTELLTLRGQVAVLRSQLAEARQAAAKSQQPASASSTTNDGEGNRAMLDFLGGPVSPPANLDFAYTKQGLINAMQSAAQSANITLANLVIDDSEFPFLVGVVYQNETDAEKLKVELQKLSGYNYSGSVSSHTAAAMDIIPNSAYPANASKTITNRRMLRQSMLFDRIRAEKGF